LALPMCVGHKCLRNFSPNRRNSSRRKRKSASRPLWHGCWQIRETKGERKRKRGESLDCVIFDVMKFDSPSSERS